MKKLTPIKAIRAKCLDCCCGSTAEVRLCTAEKCPLFPYKMGHRPKEGSLSANANQTEKTADSPHVFEKESPIQHTN